MVILIPLTRIGPLGKWRGDENAVKPCHLLSLHFSSYLVQLNVQLAIAPGAFLLLFWINISQSCSTLFNISYDLYVL